MLATKFTEWRGQGLVPDEVSDELFAELYSAIADLDRSGLASPRALEFLITALLDKIFPTAG